MSLSSSYETPLLANGKKNPKYIDVLTTDPDNGCPPFGLFSFISPEKIIKQKEIYFFEQFVNQWDLTKSTEKFLDFLNFISYKYNVKVDDLMADFHEFAKDEEKKLKEDSLLVSNDYKNYLDKNEDRITLQFNKEHQFQTSVRGMKWRGSFWDEEQANEEAKKLREIDPHHDICVGKPYVWLPLDPDAYRTGRVEFMEAELNKLHQEKMKNEPTAKVEFEKRLRETREKAIRENMELAEKTGNKLTQTIDENGKLVGVRETVDFDTREVADDSNKPALPTEAPTATTDATATENDGTITVDDL